VVHLDFASVLLPNGMRWFSDAAEPLSGDYLPYRLPSTERLRI
jgi:hypothetical protein